MATRPAYLPFGPLVVAALALPAAVTVACGSPPRTEEAPVVQALCSQPACAPDLVALAALTGLRGKRAEVFGRDTMMHVVSSVYWWPMVSIHGQLPPAIGPIPFSLQTLAERAGLHLRVVAPDSALDGSGAPDSHLPLVILGPPDFLSGDRAIIRVSLYLGPNGQELYWVLCEKGTDGRWQAISFDVELQS